MATPQYFEVDDEVCEDARKDYEQLLDRLLNSIAPTTHQFPDAKDRAYLRHELHKTMDRNNRVLQGYARCTFLVSEPFKNLYGRLQKGLSEEATINTVITSLSIVIAVITMVFAMIGLVGVNVYRQLLDILKKQEEDIKWRSTTDILLAQIKFELVDYLSQSIDAFSAQQTASILDSYLRDLSSNNANLMQRAYKVLTSYFGPDNHNNFPKFQEYLNLLLDSTDKENQQWLQEYFD